MIFFGGDYNPEQWPEQVWAEDVELMRAARVNLVTVGVFAWSALQPGPEEFAFERLDRILEVVPASELALQCTRPCPGAPTPNSDFVLRSPSPRSVKSHTLPSLSP